MESPRERACPRCTAPAASDQRWCLECGGELPAPRRSSLRPVVGIATTLAVLVGAASAGGYTLLQEDRQPPPPAQTVAQAPPTTPETLPPATGDTPTYTPAPYTPPATTPTTPSTSTPSGSSSLGGGSSSSTGTGGGTTGSTRTRDGSVVPTDEEPTRTTPAAPRFVVTDIALGAAAVAYAPFASDTADLGDASRTVDGSTRTAWRVPPSDDPAVSTQAGVYVDLAGKERLRKLVVRTPTPGMSIEVYGATSGPPDDVTAPGWTHLADRANVAEEARIKLPAGRYRYVLVWITAGPPDGGRPGISELSLLSLQPE